MHTPLNLYTKGRQGVQSVSKLVFTFMLRPECPPVKKFLKMDTYA